MHKATCDKCRRECEVPFRPTNGKPVYCSNCFEGSKGSDSRRFEGRNDRPNRSEDREMFEAVCDSCGNTCKVPFQPRGDKPIYCSNCFGEKKGAGNRDGAPLQSQPQFTDQFESLNSKLDKILQLLDSNTTPKAEVEPVQIAEQTAPKEIKVAKKRSPKKEV